MCNCNKQWVVTYPATPEHPNGYSEAKASAVAARIAASKVTGATWAAK